MGFFGNLFQAAKRKQEEMRERREFLYLVEERTKPIRRKYYLKQMMQEAIKEGKFKAQQDSQKKLQKKKTESDFGIQEESMGDKLIDGINNPYKFLNSKKTKLEKKK